MARSPRRRVTSPAGAAAPAHAAPSPEPTRRVRENLPRPAAAAPRAAGAAAPRRRRLPLDFLGKLEPRFVADVISELRKVTWPTFADTRYLTMVVAIVALTVGVFLGLIDLAFGKIIEQLFF